MSAAKEKITLELGEDHYPLVLRQYGLEGAKEMAIRMCLKQKREMTAVNLYSCLSNLESGLAEMFPPPRTPEERAADEAEAAEEEAEYQREIAEMEPYLMDGKQMLVNENGEWGVNRWGEPIEGVIYPVWKTKEGWLTARVYNAGWDWIYLKTPDEEDD